MIHIPTTAELPGYLEHFKNFVNHIFAKPNSALFDIKYYGSDFPWQVPRMFSQLKMKFSEITPY